mgnify:FL=1
MCFKGLLFETKKTLAGIKKLKYVLYETKLNENMFICQNNKTLKKTDFP